MGNKIVICFTKNSRKRFQSSTTSLIGNSNRSRCNLVELLLCRWDAVLLWMCIRITTATNRHGTSDDMRSHLLGTLPWIKLMLLVLVSSAVGK
mgnify:FL=1